MKYKVEKVWESFSSWMSTGMSFPDTNGRSAGFFSTPALAWRLARDWSGVLLKADKDGGENVRPREALVVENETGVHTFLLSRFAYHRWPDWKGRRIPQPLSVYVSEWAAPKQAAEKKEEFFAVRVGESGEELKFCRLTKKGGVSTATDFKPNRLTVWDGTEELPNVPLLGAVALEVPEGLFLIEDELVPREFKLRSGKSLEGLEAMTRIRARKRREEFEEECAREREKLGIKMG